MSDDNSAEEPTNFPVGNKDEVPSQSPEKPDPAPESDSAPAGGDSIESPETDPNRANAKPAVDEANKKL